MKKNKFSYYITCGLSGIVELGSVFLGIASGYSFLEILGLAIAYQMGNILRFFVNKRASKFQDCSCLICLIISVFAFVLQAQTKLTYILLLICLVVFSTNLQNVRSSVQGNIPRWQKRSCRVIGFFLSCVFYYTGFIALIITCAILLYYSLTEKKFYYDQWLKKWNRMHREDKICWPMVTHQAHYFAYNYCMVIVSMVYLKNPIWVALWFVANWIPYTITEPLIQKLKWNKWLVLANGAHLFNAIVIIMMALFVDKAIIVSLCLWILTGFGGGNVFTIKKALSPQRVYDNNIWNFSEQLGHILGCSAAMIIVSAGLDVKYTFIAAAIFAILTIPVILLNLKGNKKKNEN